MPRRPILVGIDPGGNPGGPLDPDFPSGARIANLCGLGSYDYLDRLDRVNLYPASTPVQLDSSAAANLRPLLRGRRVVFLGRRVSEAFGWDGEGWFRWRRGDDFVAAVSPHPSGLSRWWNDPVNVEQARDFYSSLLLPCVHVEGVDGSGKTTLAGWLARERGLALVPTDDPPFTWAECLGRVQLRVGTGVVCDRSSGLISELVYGPVLRGGTITPESELWQVAASLANAVTFVYCRPPVHELRPTFRDSEDPDHVRGVRQRVVDLVDRYDRVMARLAATGATVVRYDRTAQGLGEVLECVA
jgi:hypothetical protein